jgi:hypothetical protein
MYLFIASEKILFEDENLISLHLNVFCGGFFVGGGLLFGECERRKKDTVLFMTDVGLRRL